MSADPYVFVGAGGLGRKIAAVVRPVAFVDSFLTGAIDGIPILTSAAAMEQFPDATYVVTIWGANSDHRIRRTEDAMRRAGITRIASFTALMAAHPTLHPHYAVDAMGIVERASVDIYEAAQRWADPDSRIEFMHQVEARRSGRFDLLPEPVAGVPYFGTGLFTFRDDEAVIDGGAFDGDTFRSFVALRGGKFASWLAFEPDPANCAAFTAKLDAYPDLRPRVRPYKAALGAEAMDAFLTGSGTLGAAVGPQGDAAVQVLPLDALDQRVTLMKLDIEGMEPDALAGAWETIQRDRPVLAVCVYHRASHLWEIPNLIAANVLNYSFHLRAHGAEGWDVVCYAVPNERVA